jgi:hypothetical protein
VSFTVLQCLTLVESRDIRSKDPTFHGKSMFVFVCVRMRMRVFMEFLESFCGSLFFCLIFDE